ncbi:MAG: hypothetical protein H9535_14645 [Ignavibacteria bacterium]|nr:hypothetical protein [Ignavibacteria bacterium]MBL7993151.1 hypothetical protein [Candidatus Kapabacteria bacterium]
MAKVIFTVGYEIPESHRSQYIELVRQLKPLLSTNGTSYSVCELENKRNHFQEIYTYPNADAYEAADDTENAQAEVLIEQIYALAKDRKVTYSAAIEVV